MCSSDLGAEASAYQGVLDSWRDNLGRYTVPDFVKMQYTYEDSPISVPDGTPHDEPEPPKFLPSTRPGARAPHAWLDDGRSILDLYGDGFVLLRLGAAPAEATSLLDAARRVGMPLRDERIRAAHVAALYGRALVLVRPDGHVAWRGDAPPDRKSTRLNSSHIPLSRMPSSA